MDQTPDLKQLMKLAQSSAGQQLLRLLQSQGGSELQAAAQLASAGNLEQARLKLSALLSTPEARQLLQQLEESK